jgi:hypothetical protein
MTDWKTDLDALVFETMAFSKTIHHEQLPADLTERPILQPMNWEARSAKKSSSELPTLKPTSSVW